jgi:rubrerythrin
MERKRKNEGMKMSKIPERIVKNILGDRRSRDKITLLCKCGHSLRKGEEDEPCPVCGYKEAKR